MKILITNYALDRRAGTELYVRDLAIGLKKRGHDVVCFAPTLGAVANDIKAAGILVSNHLATITQPDIIHAHHHPAAALALLQFPRTPALFVCHGVKPWLEAPLARFPNIRRYVAVDQPCFDYLNQEHGIPEDQIDLVLNGVDLHRFHHSAPALNDPARQTRALLISNIAQPADTLPFAKACAKNGITLDVAGANTFVLDRPEDQLAGYGLVFAKARAALEAMASGCAVVLADYGKTGEVVSTENYNALRPANFGFSVIDKTPDETVLARQVAAIDWQDAARVTQRVRGEVGFDHIIDRYIDIYQSLERMSVGGSIEGGLQSYLAAILPKLAERDELASRLFHEVSSRLDRDKVLAELIRSTRSNPEKWPELLEAARWLDPENG